MKLNQNTIEGKRDGPHVLITAGVHGDEFEPMVAVERLSHSLRADELSGRVTLVPVVNETAFQLGRRTGKDDLDLARVCPGKTDGSATEQAANALSMLIQQADYFVDLHTGGVCMSVWPMTGYMLHSDPDVLSMQRRMAVAFNLPTVWGTYAGMDGRSLSVARDAKVPAIYTEYLGSVPFHEEGAEALVEGCLNVMGLLELIDRPPPEQAVRWICEDGQPGAGYMQVCHPSPHAGVFQPELQLGDQVNAGEPLGTVTDLVTHERSIIPAELSGKVLTLRSVARVEQGTGLGVIVDFEPFSGLPS